MVDKNRVLSKLDDLDAFVRDLTRIAAATFDEYLRTEKKRSCERLLQLSIESSLDICKILVSGLRLGLPSEENDVIEKPQSMGVISDGLAEKLKYMRGFRNILVHEYAVVDDQLVYDAIRNRLGDFLEFKEQILKSLK